MKAEIELSERLRRACEEKGITEPMFVAQDGTGHWWHYIEKPRQVLTIWSCPDGTILLCCDEQNPKWRETLMEFVTPKIEAGKRYWRRDGSISGVIRRISDIAELCFYDEIYSYDNEGYYIPNRRCEYDLIAEYREEENSLTLKAYGIEPLGSDFERVDHGNGSYTITLTHKIE